MKVTVVKGLIFLFCSVVGIRTSFAQVWDVDFSLFESQEYVKDDHTLLYRILFPENMEEGKKYPLFIYLHGMGAGGKDNEKQLHRGAYLFLKPENRVKYPCIALYPQVPFGRAFIHIEKNGKTMLINGLSRFSEEEFNRNKLGMSLSLYGDMVYELIQQLIERGIVDTKRIYISGSSMGAFSAFEFIAEYPDMFAAANPMSGGTALSSIDRWAGKVPVWIIHGEKDPIIPVASSRIIVDELKRQGVTSYRYTEYDDVRHQSWEKAFEEPDYLEWFFSKSRD